MVSKKKTDDTADGDEEGHASRCVYVIVQYLFDLYSTRTINSQSCRVLSKHDTSRQMITFLWKRGVTVLKNYSLKT